MYSVFEIVYNRRLQMNMAAIERLRATEARQYQMSRENIEAINIKCHDLKHQIRALASGDATVSSRVLDEISREVDVYDSVVKSSNDALDTILTEKSLYCEKHGITLSCIADGAALDFVEPTDLYSFFGNALDNAIEAVVRMADPERRSIGLVVRRCGGHGEHPRGELLRRPGQLHWRGPAPHPEGQRHQPWIWHAQHAADCRGLWRFAQLQRLRRRLLT